MALNRNRVRILIAGIVASTLSGIITMPCEHVCPEHEQPAGTALSCGGSCCQTTQTAGTDDSESTDASFTNNPIKGVCITCALHECPARPSLIESQRVKHAGGQTLYPAARAAFPLSGHCNDGLPAVCLPRGAPDRSLYISHCLFLC